MRDYGSRKFILAVASFVVVTAFGSWGVFTIADTAADIALIIGAWGTADTAIFGFYNHANVKEKTNGSVS